MVNIIHQKENTTCDISKKNILRRDSCESEVENMGSQHGHLMHEMSGTSSDVIEALQNIENGCGNVKRYDADAILALKETPQSKVKPKCADDRPFWINGKAFGPRTKKIDRAGRIGSGRLSTGEKFEPPAIFVQQFDEVPYHNNNNNNYYHHREKTGREFCDEMNKQQKKGDEYKVSFYNPVNRDHRRLLREKSEENLPEWVNAGPTSRFDTIDLHGFHDDKGESEVGSRSVDNKENRDKFGKTFSFDEFLGSSGNGVEHFGPESHNPHNMRPQGQASRFKRYFNANNNKNRDFHHNFQQQQQQNHVPPGFPPIQRPSNQFNQFKSKFDSNNNEAAIALLDLLHRQSNIDHFKQQQSGFGYNSIPSASDLESIWRQANRQQQQQQQMEHNSAMLAGKNIIDVLDVLAQSQMRANAMNFNQQNASSYNRPWGHQHQQHTAYNNLRGNIQQNNNNNQMNKYQMARVLERQMLVQGQNPMYGGLTPQDPEYWEKIRQQQQSFYQQYERNAATRQVKAKFPGHVRRVKFDEKPKLENFFHQPSGMDLPTLPDPEKAIKVEEFERKIKQVAASCRKTSETDTKNQDN